MIVRFSRFIILSFLLFLVAQSTYAHVELTYPEGGETFNSNDTITITWVEAQAHVTQNWELYYSPDAGNSWIEISTNIPVPLREFEWIVPEGETVKGRIRVVQNNAETDYDDVSANFIVKDVTGIYETPEQSAAFESFYNYPNPFKYQTTFSFKLETPQQLTLKVYTLNGSLVATVADSQFYAGQHTMNWKSTSLDAGLYYYTIRIGDAMRVKKLQIVR